MGKRKEKRGRGKKDVILCVCVCVCCNQDQDECLLGECLYVMSESIMHDTGYIVLNLVNVDAEIITLPPKKVWKNREITPKKKEHAIQFWAVIPMEQVDCCVYTVREALPQNSGRLLGEPQYSLAERS